MSGAALQDTVNRYNSFAADGVDTDFHKPMPRCTRSTARRSMRPGRRRSLHDALTGLRTNTNAEVIDTRGEVIPGLIAPANRRAALPSMA